MPRCALTCVHARARVRATPFRFAARPAAAVRSLALRGACLGGSECLQLGVWLGSAPSVELLELDLAENALTAVSDASSAAHTNFAGLRTLLSAFAPVRSSPRKPARPSAAGGAAASPLASRGGGPASRVLRALDLSKNELLPEGASILAGVLRLSRTLPSAWCGLQVLRLRGTLLGSEGAETLAPALCRCMALRELDVASCFLYDAGWEALAAILHTPRQPLETLDISCNGLEKDGARQAAQRRAERGAAAARTHAAHPHLARARA